MSKQHKHITTPAKRKADHLRLVTSPSPGDSAYTRKRRSGRRVLIGTVLVFLIVAVALIQASMNQQRADLYSLATFDTLHEVFRREGMIAFNQQKMELKKVVRHALEGKGTPTDRQEAENIAVYLYPELLPEEDMEKQVALDQWTPLQKEIERAPRSPESRILFNEMRANIWNYENPDRAYPSLSETAKQLIRIYETLSAP